MWVIVVVPATAAVVERAEAAWEMQVARRGETVTGPGVRVVEEGEGGTVEVWGVGGMRAVGGVGGLLSADACKCVGTLGSGGAKGAEGAYPPPTGSMCLCLSALYAHQDTLDVSVSLAQLSGLKRSSGTNVLAAYNDLLLVATLRPTDISL
mmetsp:Transcript_2679/g.6178  ORF Transcript_2679/g.6178 Transcript_2679/m.6178 type:complete len:151 (-) Transcript_2679:1355-1807(-)